MLLINSFAKLDPKWCSRLVHKVPVMSFIFVTVLTFVFATQTPYLNPNFVRFPVDLHNC